MGTDRSRTVGPRRIMRGQRVWLIGGLGVAAFVAFGLDWFQPSKLFTSNTVNGTASLVARTGQGITSG